MWYKDICCILKEMVENNILVPKAWSYSYVNIVKAAMANIMRRKEFTVIQLFLASYT